MSHTILFEAISNTINTLEITEVSEERKAILKPLLDYLNNKIKGQ
tara:strand:+ start:12423 stop:12557 length:135 start_codon:yes stop_codon:yes gene_type:complete